MSPVMFLTLSLTLSSKSFISYLVFIELFTLTDKHDYLVQVLFETKIQLGEHFYSNKCKGVVKLGWQVHRHDFIS